MAKAIPQGMRCFSAALSPTVGDACEVGEGHVGAHNGSASEERTPHPSHSARTLRFLTLRMHSPHLSRPLTLPLFSPTYDVGEGDIDLGRQGHVGIHHGVLHEDARRRLEAELGCLVGGLQW